MKQILLFPLIFVLAALHVSAQEGPFVLPDLPYAPNALEPFIDAATMEIHHGRHHKAYVTNLNKALVDKSFATWPLEQILIGASRRGDAIRNNGGGHYNHALFWEILSPSAKKEPSGVLAAAIVKQFGSLDSLKMALSTAASTRFGSGWAWLFVGTNRQLAISSTPNQDNPIMDVVDKRGIPILGIDVWEHAYYLKYQNRRGDYLQAIWSVLDWAAVERRYEAALKDPLLARIERDTWAELKTFHGVMSQTFHPAEEGDLSPIKARAAEMAEKAIALRDGNTPQGFRTPAVTSILQKLAAEAIALRDQIGSASDKTITDALFSLHDRFHEVMTECDH